MSNEENDSWTCPGCTLKNELIVEACAACGATSPLVLQSYAIEEQAWAEGEGAAVDGRSQRASLVSQGSENATPRGGDDGMDPWTQAECEWAHIESRQDTRSRK
ncbi:hypothetical protein JG687_00016721 [Phytophthora cactorum]|uniref:RanBP2-type domain-containing protein n=2 Tax=Phytophthora TaxID=4783 RepID=A0A329SJ81_9STRA|nr:Zinc finger, RanBP2-type [Phytophthora cactorum]KAG6975841.1 hypothetical protein JG688_00001947 [Phytophthora aleatoria]KAG2775402.1 hypothetical protein Pcac1_g13956 [Phytophthora cactorum]KAG2830404.1 hypothetical protein PC112_g7718 [Phytophthora cactorum]KAG2832790.1 hypothetical protein PC111_g6472 [Phytophthora cactorum]